MIRLVDIQRTCCAPDCERPPEPGLPIPLCTACYQLIYQQAVDDVVARVAPALRTMTTVTDPEDGERQAAAAAARLERSVVYVLRFGTRYKIGYSTDLRSRLAVLPHDEVMLTFPGGRTEERALHQRFAAHRLTGEWFAINDETTAMVQGLIEWSARLAG